MSDLTDAVRAKYPGVYDDMKDDDLEKAILAKHPEYKDLASNAKPSSPDASTSQSKTTDQKPDGSKQSPISSIWSKATTPLTNLPERAANYLSNKIDPERGTKGLRSDVSAFVEGIGHQLSGMTSPLGIALAASGAGSGLAASAGLPEVATGLNAIQRAASVPAIASGAYDIATKPHLDEKLQGVANLVLGGLGAASGVPEGEGLSRISEAVAKQEPVNPNAVELPREITTQPRPEGPWSSNTELAIKPKSAEDLAYDLAREKFNMGKDLPENGEINKVLIPEVVSEGAPPIRQKTGNFFIDDANRMQDEALSRRADPVRAAEDKAKLDEWNNRQRALAVGEGKFNKPNTKPLSDSELTPEQLEIRNSYKKIQAHSDAYAQHVSEMEENLPEDQYYEPPPGEREKYNSEQEELRNKHYDLVEKYLNKPTAEFLGMQPDENNNQIPLFNIKGGPSDGSTVGAETLQKMGIEVPEVPKNAAKLNGNQLRQIALSKKSGLNVPDDIFSSFGGNGHPDSPEYINRVLSSVESKGKPGLQVEDSDIGSHVVYRDPSGEPIGAAHVVTDKDGNNLVQDLAVDKSKGFLSGRAAVAIGNKLKEMGATNATGTISDDAANFKSKLGQQSADDIFSRPGPNSAPSFGSNQGKAADIFPTEAASDEVKADRAANPNKPKYRLDRQTGAFIPIDQSGEQIGPAVFPGKELAPELAAESKYNKGGSEEPPDKSNLLQKIYDVPRGLMSVDLPYLTSAAFRQASPYVGTVDWFKAFVPAAKSFGSKKAFDAINTEIRNRPLFKSQGKYGEFPSQAEQVGLMLTDLGKYSKREEVLRGELAEKIPLYGRYVAASNRAYTAFLNSLRANRLEDMVDSLKADNIDTSQNRTQVANAINTLTGRGKLALHPNATANIEAASKVLSSIFFSPRKIASEVQMLNPATYIMTNPVARRELLAGAIRRVATWWSIAGLAQLAGAEVSHNPTNPDFGKIKIGDTRIDPPGGLQQYLVLGAQLASGGKTSSTSGKFTGFGSRYGVDTRFDDISNFATNRFHPAAKFIVDMAKAKKSNPFYIGDNALQLATPMYMQDFAQIARDNPKLLPMLLGAPLSGVGVGVQSYNKSSFKNPTILPHEYDVRVPGR
jgi:hypothetical protein